MPSNGREAVIKGYESENNVAAALWAMQKARIIDKWWRTKRNSPEDAAGIDFFVRYKRMVIPLQVKSSESGVQHFGPRGQVINCVIGQGDNLIPRIKQAIREYRHRVLELEASIEYR